MVSAPATRNTQKVMMASLGLCSSALGFLGNQIVAGVHKAEQQPDNQQIGVHHAGDVERDFRKQKITDHILQAHDQAKIT